MKKYSQFKLIVTIALKKEVPKDWFLMHQTPVYTLDALKSGALSQHDNSYKNIMVLVAGAGYEASRETALWIVDNLEPLFVLNIGTCGLVKRKYPLCEWIRPQYVSNESGDQIELDTRIPIPHSENVIEIGSLLSVKKARFDNIPDAWKRHDALDIECYPQAKIFSRTPIHFHCLKFGTDFSDKNTLYSFNRNLRVFNQKIKRLFEFIITKEDSMGVSVVIRVFNRQKTIRRAVDSVLNQSHKVEEIIVVDDNSTDHTGKILNEYRDRIIRIFLPENSGVSKARNEGVKYASSELISFLDSDDYWERDKLSYQIEFLRKNPFYEMIQSEEIWIRNSKRVNPCKYHKKPEGWIWEESLQRCLVSPSSVILKKSLIEKHGYFNEDLRVCEDYDLWLKISRYYPVGLEPSFSLIKYGGHDDQLSIIYPAMDRFRVQTLIYLLEKERPSRFMHMIIPVLTEKLMILLKGYEKREKYEDARECQEILETLHKLTHCRINWINPLHYDQTGRHMPP